MNSVEDLDVFKLAHALALKVYSVSKKFPREEMYSLVDQMRRAASSVGMNLMEGAMRLGSKEYRQFVGIARGSAGEVCYQLLLARDLNYEDEGNDEDMEEDYASGEDSAESNGEEFSDASDDMDESEGSEEEQREAKEKLVDTKQTDLRKRILVIQSDAKLTPGEKAKKIQV